MLLCPECRKPSMDISQSSCTACMFNSDRVDSIPVFLSSSDKSCPTFQNYKQTYDQVADEDLSESFQHIEYLEAQTEKLFSYLPKNKNLSICEVGVGQGRFLKKLVTLAPKNLVGIDIAAPYLKKLMNEKVPFQPYVMNAENLCFENEFDLIISSDVLEHVLSVGNYLHCIHRALKKGGTFVVCTPYLEDYTRYSHFRGHKYDRMHFRNFSQSSLGIILKGAGFHIVKYHYNGFQDQCFRFCSFKYSPMHAIRKFIRNYYGSYIKLAAIPDWIGKILIKPTEIIAVCIKK